MRKCMLTICFVLLLGVVGCEEEKITTSRIQDFAIQLQALDTEVDSYQIATDDVLEALKINEIVGESIIEEAKKISGEIDRAQPQVADIVTAILAANLSDDEVENWIAILQAANQGSIPWNPYALPVAAILSLATLAYGLFKRKDAVASQAKYQAHKQGVEKTMIGKEADLQKEIYENIGDARTANNVV